MADGTFPLADPAADAPLIQSVVWAAAGLNPTRDRPTSRAEASRQVRSFCERALGGGPGRTLSGRRGGPFWDASEAACVAERPQRGLAVLDLYHAVDLERAQVRDRLAHRGAAHEAGDVVPRP